MDALGDLLVRGGRGSRGRGDHRRPRRTASTARPSPPSALSCRASSRGDGPPLVAPATSCPPPTAGSPSTSPARPTASSSRHGSATTPTTWEQVVATRPTAALLAAALPLGLPVATPGECTTRPGLRRPHPPFFVESAVPGTGRIRRRTSSPGCTGRSDGDVGGAVVARLSGMAGAEVVKVEDPRRPEARHGSPELFRRLHDGHRFVEAPIDSAEVRDLVRGADVVLESRPARALPQAGLDREAIAAETGCVWVSITGYGLDGGDRPAFGDDAAVAGGLLTWTDDGPVFCGDAVADPVTGMLATVGALEALRRGGPWIVDAGLAPVRRGARSCSLTTSGCPTTPPAPRVEAAMARNPLPRRPCSTCSAAPRACPSTTRWRSSRAPYSDLLAGPEFARWLTDRGPMPPAGVGRRARAARARRRRAPRHAQPARAPQRLHRGDARCAGRSAGARGRRPRAPRDARRRRSVVLQRRRPGRVRHDARRRHRP